MYLNILGYILNILGYIFKVTSSSRIHTIFHEFNHKTILLYYYHNTTIL